MVVDQHAATGEPLSTVALLADKASRLVQAVAVPSLVQLVMRVALAVPFWRSGILKWNGFLKLSDTAVTLFTDEFMLHLPGGPYPLSGAGGDGVPVRLRGNHVSGFAGTWSCDAVRRARVISR